MSLNIKNDRVSRLANELAQETGDSITDAVGKAIEEKLALLQRRAKREGLAAKITEIARKSASSAAASENGRAWLTRDYDAELYDEWGLPK